ncbi:MAG: GTPase HflX [Chloroflexi bacterium]|nr:GTPase HflX [Chloroflexota bacterium]
MPNHYEITQNEPERAILVAAMERGARPLMTLQDSLSELAQLASTAGIEVVGQTTQIVKRIDPATYMGPGKLEEVQQQMIESSAKLLVFDDELSPRHQREIEERLRPQIENVKVIDRSALILDIFAQHAQTREGALQVELAQYEYRLPRLTRQWTHLARQGGGKGSASGVGLRGPGETQLEVDRREMARKITKLKSDLEAVRGHRSRQRQQRSRTGIPVIALVGYTNAGKSTLLNALTDADAYVADQLFATLDPTTRKLELSSGRQAVISDTVGFIQKLPTTLIAAFRATLEEVAEADLLLHVVDISHPNVEQHFEAVEDTLAEIEVPPIPRILVYNKSDRWNSKELPIRFEEDEYVTSVLVSAAKRQGLENLLSAIDLGLATALRTLKLRLPYNRGDLVSLTYEQATVLQRDDRDDGVYLVARMPAGLAEQLKEHQIR